MTRSEKTNGARTALKKGATRIANRLVKVANGEEEVSATQLKAMKMVLDKVMPDLKAIEMDHRGDTGANELRQLLQQVWSNPPSRLPTEEEKRQAH